MPFALHARLLGGEELLVFFEVDMCVLLSSFTGRCVCDKTNLVFLMRMKSYDFLFFFIEFCWEANVLD